jgi:hypothetical protein
VVSTRNASVAQWDYEANDAGLSVAGSGYYSAAMGYNLDSTGAYMMTVEDTGSDGDEFDSINPAYGAGPVVGSDSVIAGPLAASWNTGSAPGNLTSVALELYRPELNQATPLPSSVLLIGLGLSTLLAWRLRRHVLSMF